MAILNRRSIIPLIFIFSIIIFTPIAFESTTLALQQHEEESFSEELLLKPLPDRKVLAHFLFETRAPRTSSYGHHHRRLFPKSIYQLVQKFRIREMELSFTQGRWNYEHWGGFDPVSSSNAKPPGVELWAVFDVPDDQVDTMWKNLTHTLSGLFCASINFLESSSAYSSPDWGVRSISGSLRYGALPREAVCTENLTPWLKLLPCRDKAGISSLMDRPAIYSGFYHSQRLHLTSTEFGAVAGSSGTVLEQTLTVVLQPTTQRNDVAHSRENKSQPDWSLTSMFGRKLGDTCVLARTSNVYVQLDGSLVAELKHLHEKDEKPGNKDTSLHGFWNNPGFELSIVPDMVIEEIEGIHDKTPSVLYKFSLKDYDGSQSFNLGMKWIVPVVWSSRQAPLHTSRFLMGSGNERGASAISLKSTEFKNGYSSIVGRDKDSCKLRIDVFQVVPWYVKVYHHTLHIFVDGQQQIVTDVIEKIRVSPSEDKVSPGVLEMVLKLPCGMQSAAFTLEFDKGFLHIDEYPPDADQGLDIPSALISFPDFHANMQFALDNISLNQSPILSKLQERRPVSSYTEVLLVPMTTPDFSMPYNVITITCTVFALYFGSLLNALRRRVGEEERLLKEKANKKTVRLSELVSELFAKLRGKLRVLPQSSTTSSTKKKYIIKVILVTLVAVCWQFYFR